MFLVAVAQVGLEPTGGWSTSLGSSQGGLPIAYRAISTQSRIRTCKHLILSQAARQLAYLGIASKVVLGGLEPPIVFL